MESKDYAPFIIQYCRTIENEILKKLFEAYHKYIIKSDDFETVIEYALSIDKTNKFAKKLKYDKRDYTLGEMTWIMNLIKEGGSTLSNNKLLQDFRNFTIRYFKESLIEKEFLDKLNYITVNFRNKAAHPYIMTLEIAKECQKLIRESLNELLDYYKSSSN